MAKKTMSITVDGKKVEDDYVVLCNFNGEWKVITTAKNMAGVIKNMQAIWNDGK